MEIIHTHLVITLARNSILKCLLTNKLAISWIITAYWSINSTTTRWRISKSTSYTGNLEQTHRQFTATSKKTFHTKFYKIILPTLWCVEIHFRISPLFSTYKRSTYIVLHTPPPGLAIVHTPPPGLAIVHTPPPALAIVHTPLPSLAIVHTPPPGLAIVHTPPPALVIVHTPPPDLAIVHTPPPGLATVHTPPSGLVIVNILLRQASLSFIFLHQASL